MSIALRSKASALVALLAILTLSIFAAANAGATNTVELNSAATASGVAPTNSAQIAALVAQANAQTDAQAAALAAVTAPDGTLRFDVAENMARFVFAPQPIHEDGMPAHGNAFITQGYIYPAGTLTESNGVLADGSPEFPDKVLGEWTCRGWFVGDGAHTTTGPWVVTTQLYNFGTEAGDATLVTEGYEIADVGVTTERAISAGTGPFANARGEGEQVFLGFNASEGVNLSFELAPKAA